MEIGEFFAVRPKEGLEELESHELKYGNGAIQAIMNFMLKNQLVDVFLSFTERKDHFSLKPVIVEEPKEIFDISLSQFIAYNLPNIDSVSKYVASKLNGAKDNDKKIGVIARPCDIRAFIELAKRDQISLDNLFVIGLECIGRIDPRELKKVLKKAEIDPESVVNEIINNGVLTLELNTGTTQAFKLGEEIDVRSYCNQCPKKVPKENVADLTFWIDHPLEGNEEIFEVRSTQGKEVLEKAATEVIEVEKLSDENIQQLKNYIASLEQTALELQESEFAKLDEMSDEERFDYIISNFEQCTSCMMCIRACPICYCKDCNVVRRRKELDPIMINLTRLSHVGDTCIACGKCSEVCPKSIPLCLISKKLVEDLKELWPGHEPGHTIEEIPPRSWKGMKAASGAE
ncbi:Coenzyme F420 hydrogenase/dehydrogenase, beta subunit C-terminal domain [Candidatus Borrarchaeum sp.]|uniref:Coenzyme F420 hydrogenase/dehydrogenase, beta subunit C-terminal domain n=1 Tax=Candidatus Borrarchaeum sp. TaxID=2846742 RepID=UPI00257DA2A9|nr:Coenzyme F420 hydrogenase/dehydrogenase, beta subunit C-terminal domain [Candidatus Borrarchaeum sp.]